MDETKLKSLIAQGEGINIEFKREIDLDSARGKAEFIKDIISLANSSTDIGYMLVGITNDKNIAGIATLPEEQIQQIVHSYVNPMVNLTCFSVQVLTNTQIIVGIIEVRSVNKPYKVSKTIENITQNKVFIRHGSVVAEASPEELFAMRDETYLTADIRQYIRAAETHAKLQNWTSAIKAYSQAIEYMPRSIWLFERGKAYVNLLFSLGDRAFSLEEIRLNQEYARLAYEDLTNSLKLGLEFEKEKDARIQRMLAYLDLGSHFKNSLEANKSWDDDLEWLKSNLHGRELGKLIVFEYDVYDDISGHIGLLPKESFDAISKAISLGYDEPDAYELRARANFFSYNYGAALEDIDIALSKTPQNLIDARIRMLEWRANILAKMGRNRDTLNPQESYVDAFSNLELARSLSRNSNFTSSLGYVASNLWIEIIYRFALAYEFEDQDDWEKERAKRIFHAIFQGSDFENVRKHYPKIANVIRKILGAEYWPTKR